MVKPEDFDGNPLLRRISMAIWAPEPVHVKSKRESDLAITQAFVEATFNATVSPVVWALQRSCLDAP